MPRASPLHRPDRAPRRRCGTALRAALVVACLALAASPRAAVRVDGDLFLGVWSPERTRWLAAVSVCVTGGGSRAAGYRIVANGRTGSDRFAMVNDIGDAIEYRVDWFEAGARGRRERLDPDAESGRSYRFDDTAGCAADDSPQLRVRVRDRDVDRAPPGIYRDTLVLTVSPI